MQRSRYRGLVTLAFLASFAVPGASLKAQASPPPYTTGPISWPEFVQAVNTGDKSKLNFTCSSLMRVMDASYDIGARTCAGFADHMKTLVEADCPTTIVYTPWLHNGEVVDRPEAHSFAGQKCRWDNEPRRVEFLSTGVPIILTQADRRRVTTGNTAKGTTGTSPSQKVLVSKGGAPAAAPPPLVNTVHDTVTRTETLVRRDTVMQERLVQIPVEVSRPGFCSRHTKTCVAASLLALGGGVCAAVCRSHETNVDLKKGTTVIVNASKRPAVGLSFSIRRP